MRTLLDRKIGDAAIIALGLSLAIMLRVSLLDFKSIDYLNYTKVWYNALKAGGFAAFEQGFSNYNLPYLYLLYLVVRFMPDLPGLVATKLPALLADFVGAWLVFRIVRFRHPNSPLPSIAAFAYLFAPTLVLNSAFWGQADALYVCALLACLYCILISRATPAMLLFGLAVAFKAQAVFLLPLLLVLLLRREIPWRSVLLIPVMPLLAIVPALLAGRPFMDLLLIYPAQAGQYAQLSMHAPSAASWIPDSGRYYPFFYPVGLIVAVTAALAYVLAVYGSRAKMTPELLLELTMISVILMPFVLPKMHERYFYLGDAISILLVFYLPSLFFVPILMISISFFAYQPTLFGAAPVPIDLLALGIFVLIVILVRHALLQLYSGGGHDLQSADAVE